MKIKTKKEIIPVKEEPITPNTPSDNTFIRVFEEDKQFFTDNEELKKYLVFKHRQLAKRQEEYMRLLKIELEEILKADAEAREMQDKKKKG